MKVSYLSHSPLTIWIVLPPEGYLCDENKQKWVGNPTPNSVSIFFCGNRIENGKAGIKMKMGYADIRKQTNTDGKPKIKLG